MTSAVVYDHVAEGADVATGSLFEGYKFWIAQRVPSRALYADKIRANGGHVVPLEKQADWLIADPFRRSSSPPGSISYEFIDKSIAKGALLDPADFPAGPPLDTARDPGSLVQPAKSTRAAYTHAEDCQLYMFVRDAQVRGGAVSGNELYKKLEHKNPRHTWQSWRDRYLKKLQYMSPSAFNTPDNVPPSLPEHQSSRAEVPVVKGTDLVKNKDKASLAQTVPVVKGTGLVKNMDKTSVAQTTKSTTTKPHTTDDSPTSNEYNVEQLAATFSTRDWEELYAFVEEIDALDIRASYEAAWQGWAEKEDNQTAEQWRQYYEKVVRPQWGRDSASKRAQIRKKVIERNGDANSSPAKSLSQSQTQKGVVASQEADKNPPNSPQRTVSNILPARSTLQSEPTAQPHSTSDGQPQLTSNGRKPALKRIRADTDAASESTRTSRPTKVSRTNSASSIPEQPLDISSTVGPPYQTQPVVIDSGDETESEESDDNPEPLTALPRPHIEQAEPEQKDDEAEDVDDLQSVASSTDLTHIAPLPRPPRIPEGSDDDDDDDDDLPSNTSTPRAYKHAAFDTQAILFPSQNPQSISRLPRPPLDSSPLHHPDSEASTTQSLQEFSSYIQDAAPDLAPHTHTPTTRLPRPTSPTPSATSTTSSSSSPAFSDPDPPLAASEMEDFFRTQHNHGFSDAFITKALKRTRFRPALATSVLEAWRAGDELPEQRGVWSVMEDELVESGDGVALARLQTKHTLDGWGGITERMNFLSAWSRR